MSDPSIHPLLPWGLFSLAVGLKLGQLVQALRRRSLSRPLSEREFRRRLERIWSRQP